MLETKSLFLMGAVALSIAGGAAAQPPGSIVWLQYKVRENDVDKLHEIVTTPVERVMKKLVGVAQINASTGHGTVDVEIGFQGDATEQDLAAVNAQIEMLNFGDEVAIVSHTVELRAPRLSFDDVQEYR